MKKERLSSACLRATEASGPVALSTFAICAIIGEVAQTWPYVLLITLCAWTLLFLFNAFIFGAPKVDGTLLIDTSNPDRDIYRMDLTNGFETLVKKKQVTFNVDINADLSK